MASSAPCSCKVRAELASLRLELFQSKRCADVAFPAVSPSEYGIYIQDGVALNENAYTVDLGALGTEWEADAPSRLTIHGAGADGATVVRRTEPFEFDQNYPNRRGCDPDPYLSHRARIDDRDRVR